MWLRPRNLVHKNLWKKTSVVIYGGGLNSRRGERYLKVYSTRKKSIKRRKHKSIRRHFSYGLVYNSSIFASLTLRHKYMLRIGRPEDDYRFIKSSGALWNNSSLQNIESRGQRRVSRKCRLLQGLIPVFILITNP